MVWAQVAQRLPLVIQRFPNDSWARFCGRPRFEIRAYSGLFYFRVRWRQSKKQPSDLAIVQYTVKGWLRRLEGCSQPRSYGRGVKSSGGPTRRTSDECLAWTTSQTRSRERRKERPLSWRRSAWNADSQTALFANA